MLSRRQLVHTAFGLTAASTLGAVLPATAQASLSHNGIDVTGTSDGFTMTDSHPAGFVTFNATTSHSQGALFSLLKLRTHSSIHDILQYALLGLSDNRSESIQGGLRLQARAEALGGAAVLPNQPVSFTSLLLPGTHFLVNYRDLWEGGVTQAAERLRRLTITGFRRLNAVPSPSAHCVFTLAGGRASYQMPSHLRARQPLRMINATEQLTEAVFMPVRQGTTRQQIQQFFDAFDRGDFSVPPPFTGGPVGVPSLSPGHTTIVKTALPSGEYCLVTWYPDFATGRMLAVEGQYQLVTINP